MGGNHLLDIVPSPPEEARELLDRLDECIGRDGVSVHLAKEVAEAEREASAALKKLIQADALHEEVLQIMADSHSDNPPVRLGGAVRALDGLLSASAASSHIRKHQDAEAGALDLTPDDIRDFAAASGGGGGLDQIESMILPHLATRIRARVDGLASFTDVRPGLSFGYRTQSLPQVLAARAARLQELKEECEMSQRELLDEAKGLKEVQVETLNTLGRLVHEYKLKEGTRRDELRESELVAYTQAQVFKVAKLRDEVRVGTYDKASVEALQEIKVCPVSRLKNYRSRLETPAAFCLPIAERPSLLALILGPQISILACVTVSMERIDLMLCLDLPHTADVDTRGGEAGAGREGRLGGEVEALRGARDAV